MEDDIEKGMMDDVLGEHLKKIGAKDTTIHHTIPQVIHPTEHDWVQRGPWLHCRSCKQGHGVRIGMNHHYKGKDKKGNLIIEKVVVRPGIEQSNQ